ARGLRQSRYFAFGFDAATLALAIRNGSANMPVSGLTGRLILTPEGRVERILLEPGKYVKPNDVIMEMENPTLARDVDMARLDFAALAAEAIALEKRLRNDLLAQEASVMEIRSQHENARFRMEANQAATDAVSSLDKQETVLLEEQYRLRLGIEEERLTHLRDLQVAELDANKAAINRAQRQVQLQEELLAGLTVRAGIEGILQEVPVEQGQQISPGILLARVAREDSLKTELRVQENQVKEVKPGQLVRISASGQEVEGVVSRIDPAVADGVVIVDVAFNGTMLPGARPDLRVQGVIEIDRVDDTLMLPRPVYSQENSTLNLFVLETTNDRAIQKPVQVGVGSLDRIQILSGLQEGDRVIVSDTTAFNGRDTLSLTD
ncbi:MAG: HlyD family efflux transporter periplasmic adaptor subunit, partial [Pseudomonadota bacterium]